MAKKLKIKKKAKKPKLQSKSDSIENVPISSLCNVAGLTTIGEQEDADPFADFSYSQTMAMAMGTTNELDDCLAAMDQSMNDYDVPVENNTSSTVEPSDAKDTEIEATTERTSTTNKLWKGAGARSSSSSYYDNKSMPDDFDLPNLQIELARHKHMGELSKYLLSQCPGMRMPTFERWIMDSKLEEQYKRRLIEEQHKTQELDLGAVGQLAHHHQKDEKWKRRMKRKRLQMKTSLEQHMTSSGSRPQNDYDCVIPSMADVEDDASQRLMEEIRQCRINNNAKESDDDDAKKKKKKKKSKKSSSSMKDMDEEEICRTLCRKSCQAARNLQNLSNHLGNTMQSSLYFTKPSSSSSSSTSVGRITLEEYTNSESNETGDETTREEDSPPDSPKLYSLVYAHKNKGEKKPKPFVVKINAMHYDKLRDMFHSIHDTLTTESSSSYSHAGKSTRNMHVPPPSYLISISNTSTRHIKHYTPATHIFHHLIFAMLVRYASLSGAQQLLDLRGGGMQGAIHSEVLECISAQNKGSDKGNANANANDTMECFASPLNVYSSKFCSIFYRDIDCHFGSCNQGDFFTLPIGFFRRGGIHEANPPFSPGLMSQMVEQMERHLLYADGRKKKMNKVKGHVDHEASRLSFVIIVPTCSMGKKRTSTTTSSSTANLVDSHAAPSFKRMLQSKYFSKHIVLASREHGYIEGSQHLRPTRYKDSQYDTSVIVLQSEAARDDEATQPNLTSDEFESKLRTAFASRHQMELSERRERVTTSESTSSHQNNEDEELTKVEVLDMNSKKRKSESRPVKESKKKKRRKNKRGSNK